jgi:hypothetical protein
MNTAVSKAWTDKETGEEYRIVGESVDGLTIRVLERLNSRYWEAVDVWKKLPVLFRRVAELDPVRSWTIKPEGRSMGGTFRAEDGKLYAFNERAETEAEAWVELDPHPFYLAYRIAQLDPA